MTVAIVGGGPTGVELSGAFADLVANDLVSVTAVDAVNVVGGTSRASIDALSGDVEISSNTLVSLSAGGDPDGDALIRAGSGTGAVTVTSPLLAGVALLSGDPAAGAIASAGVFAGSLITNGTTPPVEPPPVEPPPVEPPPTEPPPVEPPPEPSEPTTPAEPPPSAGPVEEPADATETELQELSLEQVLVLDEVVRAQFSEPAGEDQDDTSEQRMCR